jgi:hypothetical protein
MTESLKHISSHTSPGGRPQPIAFADGTLWVGCWDTSTLYAIDPTSWNVREEIALPGVPYGIAAFEGALHVVVSIGEADDRYIYRIVPGTAPSDADRIACPDFSGSHLTSNGTSLYLVQQTHRRLLELGADGAIVRAFDLPTRCAGIAFDGTSCSMISADADFDVLELATLDLARAEPTLAIIAPMHVEARGLAFDGTHFWTSYRELGEIVSFEL